MQMTAGIDPARNCETLTQAIAQAKAGGAEMLFTPEMSLLLDRDRRRAADAIDREEDSRWLNALRGAARDHRMFVALGSMAVLRDDGMLANRSMVISSAGEIVARYDKIHMFDVDLATGESWRESAAYAPGHSVVALDDTPVGRLGLSVCYDIRFPALFDALGRRQCDVIAIPAAFTATTGAAHWHLLQRARAVEATCWVVAAAQVGEHEDGRHTYGHSLVIDPWGQIVLDMGGDGPDLGFADIDDGRTSDVRRQLPSLANKMPIEELS
nr:carbon-nitrogen hydrolase family protein [Tsuneonella aeria]